MHRFFNGPGIFNSDMALLKNTQIRETEQLKFRGRGVQYLQSCIAEDAALVDRFGAGDALNR
jgi:hypothetical protein